jgi:hypothetical protein
MPVLNQRFPVKGDSSETGPGAFRDPSKEFGSPGTSSRMSPAEIAIVVVTVVTLCLGLVFIFWQRNRRQRKKSTVDAEPMHELTVKRSKTPPGEAQYPPSVATTEAEQERSDGLGGKVGLGQEGQ